MFRPSPDLLTALSQRRLAAGLWQADHLDPSLGPVLSQLGWRVIQLDLDAGTNKDQLLDALGVAAGFPDHYGRNWDAAADCLTELGFDETLAIIVNGAGVWAAQNEADARIFLSVLSDAVAWFAADGKAVYGLWQGVAPTGVPSFDDAC